MIQFSARSPARQAVIVVVLVFVTLGIFLLFSPLTASDA